MRCDVFYHFRILFAYHSGKIENEEITYHGTREISENGRVTGTRGALAPSSSSGIKIGFLEGESQ
jgi:hypothetical protein